MILFRLPVGDVTVSVAVKSALTLIALWWAMNVGETLLRGYMLWLKEVVG